MIDTKTGLPVSDTNGSHPDLVLEALFQNVIIREDCPKDTILLVPPVTLEEHINVSTGEIKQYFMFDEKAGGVITNIGPEK